MLAHRVGEVVRLTAALLAVALPAAAQELSEGCWTAEAPLGPETMTLLLDVERREGELGFRIPHADRPMDFAGRLGAEQRLEGELAMGGHAVPLVFAYAGATPERPYCELEVSFAGEGPHRALAFGERDERLPAEACAVRLLVGLERAGGSAVTLHRYVGANHALLPAPDLEQDLARWLRERAGT